MSDVPDLLTGKQGDKDFIQNPSIWPQWPFCPMRKRDEKEHFPFRIGVIAETSEPDWKSTVYLDVNLYHKPELRKAEKKVYSSIDEMLVDGWQVD